MISQAEATARKDNRMDEIDGPPRAYFEIPFPDVVEIAVLRIEYVTIIWPITQEQFEDNIQTEVAGRLVTAIKDELFKLGGGIIWWRTRPALQTYDGPQGTIFKIRCRVATTPMLSNETWDKLYRHYEGSRIL